MKMEHRNYKKSRNSHITKFVFAECSECKGTMITDTEVFYCLNRECSMFRTRENTVVDCLELKQRRAYGK